MEFTQIEKFLKPYRRHEWRLLQELEGLGCLRDERLRGALLAAPRHRFIDRYFVRGEDGQDRLVTVEPENPSEEALRHIYANHVVMTRAATNPSSCSQPSLVFHMLESLDIREGAKVLEIGTGTGWNAALISGVTGEGRCVHSIDIQPDLVEDARGHLDMAGFPGVRLGAGDGGRGWPGAAPFDRIIVTASAADLPPEWLAQLAEGGILIFPFAVRGIGDPLLWLRKRRDRVSGRFVGRSWFMSLKGAYESGDEEDRESAHREENAVLAAEEPHAVLDLPEKDAFSVSDWVFWMRAMGIRMDTGWMRRAAAWEMAARDAGTGALALEDRKDWVLRLYGDTLAVGELVQGLESWRAAGRPGLDDWAVTVVLPGAEPPKGGWLERRSNATLAVSPLRRRRSQ